MTTVEFLRDHPHPTEREIREGLAGNLCRCTGYQNIVKAVAAAAEMLAASGAQRETKAVAAPSATNVGAAPRKRRATPATSRRARHPAKTPKRRGASKR